MRLMFVAAMSCVAFACSSESDGGGGSAGLAGSSGGGSSGFVATGGAGGSAAAAGNGGGGAGTGGTSGSGGSSGASGASGASGSAGSGGTTTQYTTLWDVNAIRTFAENGAPPYATASSFVHILGSYPKMAGIPETGILGTTAWSSDGSYARLKRIDDPNPPGGNPRKVFDFRFHRDDPDTAGPNNRRVEFAGGGTIDRITDGKVYWVVTSYMFPEAATVDATDTLGMTQIHCDAQPVSGSWHLRLQPGKFYRIAINLAKDGSQPASWANTSYVDYDVGAMAQNVWDTFVFKFSLGYTDSAFLQVWRNGKQVANHKGKMGYPDSPGGYLQGPKIYNWLIGKGDGDQSKPERRVLTRGQVFLEDQPGLTEPIVRALLK